MDLQLTGKKRWSQVLEKGLGGESHSPWREKGFMLR